MVVHEHVGVKRGGRQMQVVGELREKVRAVVVMEKDRRPAVSAAGDVIQGVGKIDAWRTRHREPAYRAIRASQADQVECVSLTLMLLLISSVDGKLAKSWQCRDD